MSLCKLENQYLGSIMITVLKTCTQSHLNIVTVPRAGMVSTVLHDQRQAIISQYRYSPNNWGGTVQVLHDNVWYYAAREMIELTVLLDHSMIKEI